MWLWLLDRLGDAGLRVPVALEAYSVRMLLACISSLLICLLVGPRFIHKLYEWKIGQKVGFEECPLLGQLHEKKRETPTMGGLLILLAMSASALVWMDWSHLYTWLLLIGSMALGALGAYDDRLKLKWKNSKGLSPRKKMAGQLTVGVLLCACLLLPVNNMAPSLKYPRGYELSQNLPSGDLGEDSRPALKLLELHHLIYIPGLKQPLKLPLSLWSGLLLAAFFCFVIAGSSNAVNLTDGLDGLATGTTILVAACLAVAASISDSFPLSNYLNWLYIEGSGEVAVFLTSLIGALLGFLWFNSPPAQLFMGDTGSLGIGGALGIAAILLRRELFFALASGVFVLETLSVIIQVSSFRWRQKRAFLCSPLHHHFEYKGWPETKVVIRFWILGLLFAMAALITIKLQ